MEDEFQRFYHRNFAKVFAYFYALTASTERAKHLTTVTFERAGAEWRGGRSPPLSRSSLFALARAVYGQEPGVSAIGPLLQAEDDTLAGGHDLVELLSRLDPLSRELVSLRFDAGLTYGEIADIVGLTRAEIARRVLQAVRRLTASISQP